MADEETRADEEPEVEGHGFKGGQKGDVAEGTSAGAQDEGSDDVEAHLLKEGFKGGFKGGQKGGHID